MNETEIRTIVYGLLEAGLVEIVRAEGAPMPAQAEQFEKVNKVERESLVNRLIDRIRSL